MGNDETTRAINAQEPVLFLEREVFRSRLPSIETRKTRVTRQPFPKDGASSPSTDSCKTQLASNDREDKANKDTQTPVLFEGVFKCRLAHTAESQ